MEASTYNDQIMKRTLTYDEIAEKINQNLLLEVTPKQIKTSGNLNLFGHKKINIVDFYYKEIEQIISIEINIFIKRVRAF